MPKKRSTKTDGKASKQLNKQPKAKKPLTHAQLKKKVDEWFSKAIRYRAADKDGFAECWTCGTRHHVGNLQAGHFASRRHMATRWDDRDDGASNVMPQCIACNLYDQGRQWYFGRRLDEVVSGRAEDIMRTAQRPRSYGVAELRQLLERYKMEATAHMVQKPAIANRPAKGEAYSRTQRRKEEAAAEGEL